MKSFSVRKTIINHYSDILNFFDIRSTNASAESFNAKIKTSDYSFGSKRQSVFPVQTRSTFCIVPSFVHDP
ncbi:transposase [Chryseobacterium fluminis]|uniref:transposase n=1 Tax=Chryseobacterium fluminis TaxID=2983606 RepID=UPI002B25732C|nr:transposase [Chryseobacterium sp. MMS21-Ot14]